MALEPPISNIPLLRQDGYLPEGVYVCSEAEVIFRFGFRAVGADAWCGGYADGWSWDGRSEPGACWWMAALSRRRMSWARLTRLSCCLKISLSSLRANMNQRWS